MPRPRWRPPTGTKFGICPACEQWAPLTGKGYIQEHHVITRDGRPVAVHTMGAVVTTGERVIRCVGIGRDPRKHECRKPQPGLIPGSTWTCRCGLTWVTVVVEKRTQWAIK